MCAKKLTGVRHRIGSWCQATSNGSVCNPLTAAIFDTEDLDLRRGPYPFREGGRRRKARRGGSAARHRWNGTIGRKTGRGRRWLLVREVRPPLRNL